MRAFVCASGFAVALTGVTACSSDSGPVSDETDAGGGADASTDAGSPGVVTPDATPQEAASKDGATELDAMPEGSVDGSADAAFDATVHAPGSDAGEDASDGAGSALSDGAVSTGEAASMGDGAATLGALCTGCPSGQKLNQEGACVSATDPYWGCGVWNHESCNVPNAVAACAPDGSCAVGSCRPGWADCNGLASDGCEANLESPSSCGTCTNVCSGGTPLCDQGTCAATCGFPTTNCNGSCAPLQSDPANCGSCATACPALTANPHGGDGAPICTNGQCGDQCDPGFTYRTGYGCRDTQRDPLACGSSMVSCLGTSGEGFFAACAGGACEGTPACPYGAIACDGGCVRTDFDPSNCGACGNSCPGDDICQQGQCEPFANIVIATTGLTSVSSGDLSVEQPGDVFIDGTHVLFTDLGANSVGIVPLAGGTPTTLGSNQAAPIRIVGDGVYAYWSSYLGGAILRAREDGTGGVEVVASASKPWALAVDTQYVYWVDTQTSQFLRAPKSPGDGGAPVALSGQPITTGAAEIYIDSSGTLVAGCQDGPCTSTTADGPFVATNSPGACSSPLTFQDGVGWCTFIGGGSVTWFETSDVTETWSEESGEDGRVSLFSQAIPSSSSCAVFAAVNSGIVVAPLLAPVPAAVEFPIAITRSNVWNPSRMSRSGTSLVFSFRNFSAATGGIAHIEVPPQ